MERIEVDLRQNRYPVLIDSGLLKVLGSLIPKEMEGAKVAVVTNPTVNALFGSPVEEGLRETGCEPVILLVPDSETAKSLQEAERLWEELVKAGLDRTSFVVALGGGVVGDLAGFVAATYMRGIGFVNIPTTLLAQVDSAIGGKTGVDLPAGKNLVGAFHQPRLVVSDTDTLKTLPDREFRSGLAEVVKYGLIMDRAFFDFLECNVQKLKDRDEQTITQVVARCSKLKASVVEEDEREEGKRIMLNLGHTLGHAIEAAAGYVGYSHGEGVAIGMVYAARLALERGSFDQQDLERLENLLDSFGLPTGIRNTELSQEDLIRFMKVDKKARDGSLRFVVPDGIGKVSVVEDITPGQLKKTLEEVMG